MTATAPIPALAETMQRPGFGLFKTFNEVGLAVEKATHGDQLPWCRRRRSRAVSISPASLRSRSRQACRHRPHRSNRQPSRHATMPCAAISSSIATGSRRCPTIPVMRGGYPAWRWERSTFPRQRPPATMRCNAISGGGAICVRGRARRRRAQGLCRGATSL